MPQLWRITVDWTGGKVGTGFSNLFFSVSASSAQVAADSVRTFFSNSYSVGALLPTGVVLSFRPVVDTIELTNGELTSTTAITTPAPITGSDSGRYAAVAGACVSWRTGDFVAGRRVRGRTFLVPLGSQGLQADGTIDTTALGFIQSAATALITAAPELVVWRRPTSHAAADGSAHIVGAATVSDKTAFLSSRR